MGLANLLKPPPGASGWNDFWFNNWIDHQEIQQAVYKQYGTNQQVYVIIPWNPSDVEGILQRHQQFHDDMDSALKLASQDLSTLDFKDQEKLQIWVFNHYLEHQAAHEALGI